MSDSLSFRRGSPIPLGKISREAQSASFSKALLCHPLQAVVDSSQLDDVASYLGLFLAVRFVPGLACFGFFRLNFLEFYRASGHKQAEVVVRSFGRHGFTSVG